MANSKQAIKRVRQNSDKYKLRHAQRSVVRTAVKAVKANIDIKDKSKATELFIKAQKIILTAGTSNLIFCFYAAYDAFSITIYIYFLYMFE